MKAKQPAGSPMTQANMRELGVQRLIASCLNDACCHTALIDVSGYPADTEVPFIRSPGEVRQVLRQARRRAGRTGKSSHRAPHSEAMPVRTFGWDVRISGFPALR